MTLPAARKGRTLLHALLAALPWVCLPSPLVASEYSTLSALERESVDKALQELDFTVDPAPEGKRVGQIHVSNREVFSESADWLTFANMFHYTTRNTIVAREVLLEPGDLWDPELVDETERNLLDPYLRTVVVVLPVRSAEPGTVDVLVVTRDLWSLRGNTNFQTTGSVLNYLSTSLSENNFLGYNKKIAATFKLDQDTYDLGALYFDPRLGGTRLALLADQSFLLNRDTNAFEGTAGLVTLSLPLYSVRQKWGMSATLEHLDETYRDFEGDSVRTWDDPATLETEALPRVYDYTGVSFEAVAVRSFGHSQKLDLSFGYGFDYSHSRVPGDFPAEGPVRERFEAAVLPRSETASYGIFGMSTYRNDFVTLYDVETLALSEEYRTGPSAKLTARWASQAVFFSETDYLRLGLELGWTVDLGHSALLFVNAAVGSRLQGSFIDSGAEVDVSTFTPVLLGFARIHARAFLGVRWDETRNAFYTLGGDNGLRGVSSRSLAGEDLLRTNLELRTLSLGWWIFRTGLVAFYDTGDAFDSFDDLEVIHSVGLGARILIVSMNRNVLRLDYAVPLNGPMVGFESGVFTAGFDQAF